MSINYYKLDGADHAQQEREATIFQAADDTGTWWVYMEALSEIVAHDLWGTGERNPAQKWSGIYFASDYQDAEEAARRFVDFDEYIFPDSYAHDPEDDREANLHIMHTGDGWTDRQVRERAPKNSKKIKNIK